MGHRTASHGDRGVHILEDIEGNLYQLAANRYFCRCRTDIHVVSISDRITILQNIAFRICHNHRGLDLSARVGLVGDSRNLIAAVNSCHPLHRVSAARFQIGGRIGHFFTVFVPHCGVSRVAVLSGNRTQAGGIFGDCTAVDGNNAGRCLIKRFRIIDLIVHHRCDRIICNVNHTCSAESSKAVIICPFHHCQILHCRQINITARTRSKEKRLPTKIKRFGIHLNVLNLTITTPAKSLIANFCDSRRNHQQICFRTT